MNRTSQSEAKIRFYERELNQSTINSPSQRKRLPQVEVTEPHSILEINNRFDFKGGRARQQAQSLFYFICKGNVVTVDVR